jgi:putative ABC transport system substrate-binding protein
MDRRKFINALAAGVFASTDTVRAQKVTKVYRIGMLEAVSASQNAANLVAFREGLRDAGYAEGKNLLIEYRSADGRAERFPELASELVTLKVDVIVSRGTPATRAARNATTTIPVVMATMGEVRGLVAGFARPGGNVTGFTTFTTELTAKRLELLKELVPNLSRVAMLHNMSNPAAAPEWEEVQAAARVLSLQAELLDVRNRDDLEAAFERALQRHVDALVIGADGVTQVHQRLIIDSVARSRLATSYPTREAVEAGGLISYAIDYPDLYLRLAGQIAKIFNGTSPRDIPVEQPTKVELAINLGTARALGLTVPQPLLLRANRLIQ